MSNNIIKEYWPTVFTLVIIFIFLIVLFQILNFNLNKIETMNEDSIHHTDNNHHNHNIPSVDDSLTVETFTPSSSIDFIQKINDNDPVKLNDICKSFSHETCKISDFCVLLNGEKCVGGNVNGPTFLTEQGKDVDLHYYIHKNKCRGECPPTQ